jgi:hypothetical protein
MKSANLTALTASEENPQKDNFFKNSSVALPGVPFPQKNIHQVIRRCFGN